MEVNALSSFLNVSPVEDMRALGRWGERKTEGKLHSSPLTPFDTLRGASLSSYSELGKESTIHKTSQTYLTSWNNTLFQSKQPSPNPPIIVDTSTTFPLLNTTNRFKPNLFSNNLYPLITRNRGRKLVGGLTYGKLRNELNSSTNRSIYGGTLLSGKLQLLNKEYKRPNSMQFAKNVDPVDSRLQNAIQTSEIQNILSKHTLDLKEKVKNFSESIRRNLQLRFKTPGFERRASGTRSPRSEEEEITYVRKRLEFEEGETVENIQMGTEESGLNTGFHSQPGSPLLSVGGQSAQGGYEAEEEIKYEGEVNWREVNPREVNPGVDEESEGCLGNSGIEENNSNYVIMYESDAQGGTEIESPTESPIFKDLANDYLLGVYEEAERKAETKIQEGQHLNRQTLIIDPQDVTAQAAIQPLHTPNISISTTPIIQHDIQQTPPISLNSATPNYIPNQKQTQLFHTQNHKIINDGKTKYSAASLFKYAPIMEFGDPFFQLSMLDEMMKIQELERQIERTENMIYQQKGRGGYYGKNSLRRDKL